MRNNEKNQLKTVIAMLKNNPKLVNEVYLYICTYAKTIRAGK